MYELYLVNGYLYMKYNQSKMMVSGEVLMISLALDGLTVEFLSSSLLTLLFGFSLAENEMWENYRVIHLTTVVCGSVMEQQYTSSPTLILCVGSLLQRHTWRAAPQNKSETLTSVCVNSVEYC